MPPTDLPTRDRVGGPSGPPPPGARRPRPAPPAVRAPRPRADDPERRAAGVRFRRALTLMLMTLVLPGSAQLVAGDRRVGRFALRVWLGLVGVVALVALVSLVWDGFAFSLALNTDVLGVLRLLLIALALGWAALFVDAWRLGEPMTLQRNRRLVAVGVNGVLCFSVVGSLLFGAHIVGAGQGAIQTVFGEGEATEATGGRYNVLLLGADAGDGRVGLRTDSMTLASIDEQSGETVLVSLPRNLANFPFAPGSVMDEQFPDGFDCEGCYLNGVTTWATDHPDLFGASSSASEDELFEIGMDATLSAVEGVTDLDVNYWAMVDMGGFERLVDAVGGVEMNVRSRIPIGGVGSPVYGYIEPGVQQLDGYQALWFSRSREDSDDYSRMARQKCVMSAMLQQLDPATLVSRFGEIAAAGSAMLETSIPRSELDTFVDLALKARSEPIATVSIVPPAVDTANPDMAVVHRMIDDAVGRSSATADSAAEAAAEAEASAAATEAATESDAEAEVEGEPTVTGGSLGSRDDGYTANETTDLGSSC